jgi:hypothetical protein
MKCSHPKGITCPKCNRIMDVDTSRPQLQQRVLRYRVCICGVKATTRETVVKIRYPK